MKRFTVYYTEQPTAGKDFIRLAASAYTHADCTKADIRREPTGKPFFENKALPFFSLSHSGGFTVCAMGPSPCGIDIQEHLLRGREQDPLYLCRLAKRFFHPDESAMLEKAESKELCPLFFDLWSAKESYVKYTGQGITAFPTFSVLSPDSLSPAVIQRILFSEEQMTPSKTSLFLTADDPFAFDLQELNFS